MTEALLALLILVCAALAAWTMFRAFQNVVKNAITGCGGFT